MRLVALSSLLALLAGGLTAHAQELRVVSQARIPLGPGTQQVGVEQAEGEFWAPLFFALDSQGRIHVADFYHGRVAVFGPGGEFVRGVPTPQGVTPAMNYFGRVAATGDYVTVSRQSLYLLDPEGKARWISELGSVPSFIYPSADALFVLVHTGALVYAYSSPQPIGTFGTSRDGTTVPLLRADNGVVLAFKAKDMQVLEGYSAGAFRFGTDAWFAGADTGGQTLWRDSSESSDRWYLADALGRQVRSGTTPRGEGLPGSGFWSYVGPDLRISKAAYADDSMIVTTYAFR